MKYFFEKGINKLKDIYASPAAMNVYIALIYLNQEDDWWIEVSIDDLIDNSLVSSRHTVINAINDLEQVGLIEVVRPGRYKINKYHICESNV